MIRYRVCLPDDIKRHLPRFPPTLKRRVRAALDFLEVEPRAGKPLERELTGWWSCAVVPFRIIYRIGSSRREIHVVAIEHRREVYDFLAQQLQSFTVRERKISYGVLAKPGTSQKGTPHALSGPCPRASAPQKSPS